MYFPLLQPPQVLRKSPSWHLFDFRGIIIVTIIYCLKCVLGHTYNIHNFLIFEQNSCFYLLHIYIYKKTETYRSETMCMKSHPPRQWSWKPHPDYWFPGPMCSPLLCACSDTGTGGLTSTGNHGLNLYEALRKSFGMSLSYSRMSGTITLKIKNQLRWKRT